MVSPLYINIAIWYHTRPVDYEHNGSDIWPEVVMSCVKDMVQKDILARMSDNPGTHYAMTDRGHAWVGFICDVPFPVAKWVLP